MSSPLTKPSFRIHCDDLGECEPVFKRILKDHGYPPFWTREPNFATLVQIILEQQVSLASASAAYKKLIAHVQDLTPESIHAVSDEALKSCYFSRQKTRYVRALTEQVRSGKLVIETLTQLNEDEVRAQLTSITGIGDWSASVFLMEALNRPDYFPLGDVALLNSMKHEFELGPKITKEELGEMALEWAPRRTVASYLLWHAYIERKQLVYPWSG